MAEFNADFWEVQAGSQYLESLPASRGLWFETDEDSERRHAFKDFFQEVRPMVDSMIDSKLTRRQQEVVKLYYFYDKTQEDIAVILDLSQSTVSRHLFGTVRHGKKVGGAIPKLKKVISKANNPEIDAALGTLKGKLAEAV